MRRIKFLILLIFVFGFVLFFSEVEVEAAKGDLFLSPSSGEYAPGSSMTLRVMVDSGGSPGINAAEGEISFDPEYLSVSSVSDSDSIFSLWVTDPTYSNSAGTLSFGGGLPSAYTGDAGLIFTAVFNVKKAGETSVRFTRGQVLAYGPTGEEVTNSLGSGSYTFVAEEPEEEPEEEVEIPDRKPEAEEPEPVRGILPPKPEIDSDSHEEEDVWYSDNDPDFSWKMLADLSGVSILITDEPDSDPGPISDGIIETKQFRDQDDGEWYIHVKYQNNVGWGKIAHRKFLIDTTAPQINDVQIDNGGDSNNPNPEIVFDIEDETSGIDYYALIQGEDVIEIPEKEVSNGRYRFDLLAPGEHSYNFAAYDMAGNVSSSSINFFIDPLKAPIISDIPAAIKTNEELVIRGKSFYSDVDVNISIAISEEEEEVFKTRTDDDGNWSYFHKGELKKGNYKIRAWVVDDRGAQSFKTGERILLVSSPDIIEAYGLLIILFLLLVIALLVLYIWYIKHKFREEKIRIARETDEAKLKLGEIFSALRDEVDELMALADKKTGLSESERRVKNKLQDALDISEEFIGKEIEDVNKEVHIKKDKK